MLTGDKNSLSEPSLSWPIWVSYAGADQGLVDALAEGVREKNKTLSSESDALPICLKTFLNTDKKSKEDYYLELGDNISELVQVIASSLRCLVVITPNYFKSEFCLWELCACLIARSSERSLVNGSVAIVYAGFTARPDLLGDKKLVALNGSSACSLVEALVAIYKKKHSIMTPRFRLPRNTDQELSDFFDQALSLMVDQVKLKNLHWDAGVAGSVTDQVDDLFLYAQGLVPEETREFDEFLQQQYKKWCEKYENFIGNLPSSLGEDFSGLKPKIEDVVTLASGGDAAQVCFQKFDEFAQFLIRCLEAIPGSKKKDIDPLDKKMARAVRDFSAMLVLMLIDKRWAAEMRSASFYGAHLRFSCLVNQKDAQLIEAEKKFYMAVATAVIRLSTIENFYITSPIDDAVSDWATMQDCLSEEKLCPVSPEPIEDLPATFSEIQKRVKSKEEEQCKFQECLWSKIFCCTPEEARKILDGGNWGRKFSSKVRNYMDENGILTKWYLRTNIGEKFSYEKQLGIEECVHKMQDAIREHSGKNIVIPTVCGVSRDEGNTIRLIEMDEKGGKGIYQDLFALIEELLLSIERKFTPVEKKK